jgi:hypothetical protein
VVELQVREASPRSWRSAYRFAIESFISAHCGGSESELCHSEDVLTADTNPLCLPFSCPRRCSYGARMACCSSYPELTPGDPHMHPLPFTQTTTLRVATPHPLASPHITPPRDTFAADTTIRAVLAHENPGQAVCCQSRFPRSTASSTRSVRCPHQRFQQRTSLLSTSARARLIVRLVQSA